LSELSLFPKARNHCLDLLLLIASSVFTGADPITDAKADVKRQAALALADAKTNTKADTRRQVAGCSATDNTAYSACVDGVDESLPICEYVKKLWMCLPACSCSNSAHVETVRSRLAASISVIKLVDSSTDCGDTSTWKCGSADGIKSSAAGLHATVFIGIIASLATLLASY
jgi:hypothetical protein